MWTAQEARDRLYEIVRRDTSFDEKARDALELGRQFLGADNGHLTRVDRETDSWEVLVSTDPPDGRFPSGIALDLGQTYCRRAIASDAQLALYDARNQGFADDPAFETHGLHRYLGTPLRLDEKPYGTVCFVADAPRDEPFSDAELLFAELVTQVLERELERDRYELELFSQTNLSIVLNRVLRHNLRNDLAIIRGYTQLLVENPAEERYGDVALSAIDDLIELGEKARKLEKVVGETVERETLDLASLAADVATAVASEHPSASIEIECDEPITATVLQSFGRALEELIENAVKHAGEEPSVTVEAEPSPHTVEVRVADDGPGLSDQERNVLGSGAETPLVHGSGLGLWLVHWIVDSHDGTVDATVTDAGTEMTVAIPRRSTTGLGDQLTKLTRARDTYEAAFEAASDGLVLINDDARIVDANPAATQIYGYDRPSLLGRPLPEFLPAGFDFESAWLAFKRGELHRDTVTLLDENGDERHVEYAATTDVVPGQHLLIVRELAGETATDVQG